MNAPERPDICTQEMLVFLDVLHAEGNMAFGITERVQHAFRLSSLEAVTVINYWMATYGQEGPR